MVPGFAKHWVGGWALALLLLIPAAGAQETADQDPKPGVELAERLGIPAVHLGYLLFDLQTGEIYEAHQEEQPFIPASVAKVPTAVAAMNILGANHHFKTEVFIKGEVRDGLLYGDLYLRGGGDPFLATESLDNLARAVAGQGITGITGRFIYDVSQLPEQTEINALQPIDASYNPGLTALPINFNVVHLSWSRRADGSITYQAISKSDLMAVEAETVTLKPVEMELEAGSPLVYDGIAAGESWLLPSSFPDQGTKRVPLKRPAFAAAMAFRLLAGEQGVSLPEPAAGSTPIDARLAAGNSSLALYDILDLVLKWSNNQSAELVGLAAAQRLNPRVRDLSLSTEVIRNWYRARMPSVDWEGYQLDNHSGLSSASRVTTMQLAAILRYSEQQRIQGLSIFPLLKPLGVESRLNEQFGGAVRVRVKTGTINYGRALAGYLQTVRGRRLGFVTWVMDEEARAVYDRNLQNGTQDAAKASFWLRRARAVEDELISRWVTIY